VDPGPRYGSLRRPPIAFGHRGARAHAPENTIDSFRLALRLGASGLESDVWLTADKVAVLDHDGLVRSGLRRRPIASVRRAQLPGHIPTLEALLEACGDDYELSLDIKDADAGAVVIDIVRATAPALLPRLWLCHPSWRAVAALRPLDDTVKLVDSTRLERIKGGAERRAADLRAAGVDAINMHHSDWTAGLVTLFHRFNRFALAWDLQYEHLLQAALRMGLDGVYSDHVDRMVDAFRAEGIEVS
jgi:glycerophosphoryl diester phosphodiesterase